MNAEHFIFSNCLDLLDFSCTMEKLTFSRKALYDLIWASPLSALAKKYNISDVGLRKIALRMGIPLPDVGYWNKLAAGKQVVVLPLSVGGDFEQEVLLELREGSDPLNEVGLSEQILLQRKLEADPSLSFKVSKQLINPEPETLRAKKDLEKAPSYYRVGEFYRTTSNQTDIRVAPENVGRALLLMDAFLKIIRKRGVFIYDGEFIRIENKELKFKIYETRRKSVDQKPGSYLDFVMTGKLSMKFEGIWVSVSISDGKELLESQLAKLVSKLELLAPRFKKEEEDRQEHIRIREEEQRIKKELNDRREAELKGVYNLFKDFKRWEEIKRLRVYLEELEKSFKARGELTDEEASFLQWARAKADWLDPAIDREDEWLEAVNKDVFFHTTEIKESAYSNNYRPSGGAGWPVLPWYMKK